MLTYRNSLYVNYVIYFEKNNYKILYYKLLFCSNDLHLSVFIKKIFKQY